MEVRRFLPAPGDGRRPVDGPPARRRVVTATPTQTTDITIWRR